MTHFQDIRQRLAQLQITAPAFCAFAAMAAGCAVAAYGGGWGVLCAVMGCWLGAGRWSGRSWRHGALLALLTLAAWAWGQRAVSGGRQDYLKQLPREGTRSRVTLRLRLRETPFREGRLGTLPARQSMTADILEMQCLGMETPRHAKGRIVLFAGASCTPLPNDLLPGDVLWVTGLLERPPDEPPLAFYSRQLASRGIWRQLMVTEYEIESTARIPACARARRLLHRLRAALAERLVRHVEDDRTAGMLLGLGLGMGQFIPQAERQRQVAAGTVHVFAISGMHLDFVALLVALAARYTLLPLRTQWLLTGAAALVYVMLTGAAASALRALLMAWAIVYARLRWRPPSWLNAVGVAGCLALAARPLAVFDLGFIYSYSVMTTLLLSAPMLSAMGNDLSERLSWLPVGHRPLWRVRWGMRLAQGTAGSSLAWLSSAGTAMALNAKLTLAASLYCLPLGTLAFMTLLGCLLRLLAGLLLPWWDGLWAAMLSRCMETLAAMAAVGAESATCLPIARLDARLCLVFHIALILWLLGKS